MIIIEGCNYVDICRAVEVTSMDYAANIVLWDIKRRGHGFRVKLSVADPSGPGARRGVPSPFNDWEQQPVRALCWHGYRDVIAEVFTRCPDAVMIMALGYFDGQGEFLARFPATGDINIGSHVSPCLVRDACECPYDRDKYDPLVDLGGWQLGDGK